MLLEGIFNRISGRKECRLLACRVVDFNSLFFVNSTSTVDSANQFIKTQIGDIKVTSINSNNKEIKCRCQRYTTLAKKY